MHAAEQVSRPSLPRTAKTRSSDLFSTTSPKDGQETGADTTRAQETDPAGHVPISQVQIRAALANALTSPEFQSAPQLQAFLDFVVQAALSENRQKIKGYTIAIEALGRPEDFNPVTDPIVRVEAARLRRRLATFYAGSGATDPVRITIPKGSYFPKFCVAEPASIFESADVPSPGNSSGAADTGLPPEEFRGFFGPLQEEPDDSAAMFDAIPAHSGPPPRTQAEAPNQLQPELAGAQTGLELPVPPLPRHGISFPLMVAIGLICFIGGYLAGAL